MATLLVACLLPTEYYHEIILDSAFNKDETLVSELDIKTLFDTSDKINPQLIKQYLPAITTLNKVWSKSPPGRVLPSQSNEDKK